MQPGQFAPPPAPPAPAKKSNIWLWVLGGLGAIILLVIGAIVVGGLFLAKTVKEVATNPARLAEIIAKVNPDIEVLDVDDTKKTVRIKDKKSGEVINVSLDDVMNGKIQVSKEGGGKEGESASITFGGKANLPDFVPKYPGAEPQALMSGINIGGAGDKGTGGTVSFTTKDALEKVRGFYEDAFKKSGMKVETSAMSAEGGMMSARSEDDKLTVAVTLGRSGDETSVVVLYGEKK